MQTSNRSRLFTRISVWFHALVLLLLLIWASVGNWIAEWQWQTTVTPLKQTLLQEFPPRSNDAKAIQLQALATNLEFDLTLPSDSPSPNPGRVSVSPSLPQSNSSVLMNAEIHDFMYYLGRSFFFKNQQDNVSPLLDALPAYLTKHQTDINEIINLLTDGNLPLWARPPLDTLLSTPESPEQNLLINLKKLINLHRLLLLISLEYDRQEQPQFANQTLIAAWNLMYSLVDQPLGLNASMLQDQAKGLRLVNINSAQWRQRWARSNPLQLNQGVTAWVLINGEFIKAIANCARPTSSACSEALSWGSLFRPLVKPYFTFAATDFVQKVQYVKIEDPCLKPLAAFRSNWELEEHPVIAWNVAYALYVGFRWRTTKDTLLNWEATGKILQIREQLAPSRKPPASIAGLEPSNVCPSIQWTYEVLEDGNVRISSADPTLSYTSSGNRFRSSEPLPP